MDVFGIYDAQYVLKQASTRAYQIEIVSNNWLLGGMIYRCDDAASYYLVSSSWSSADAAFYGTLQKSLYSYMSKPIAASTGRL